MVIIIGWLSKHTCRVLAVVAVPMDLALRLLDTLDSADRGATGDEGAPIAQLGERRTLDRKVAGSIITRGAVLCP